MYRNKKIIAFTPFGRERTVSVLLPYMEREFQSGVLDEWMLCMNTDVGQLDDIAYAEQLAEDYSWINLYDRPGPDSPEDWAIPPQWRRGFREPKQLNTGRFFWYMQDREALYLRFDDDVVWVHRNAVRAMVDRKLSGMTAGCLAVFPVIWNNAVSSWLLQQYNHPTVPNKRVQKNAVDPVGWGDPRFAIELHGNLLDVLEAGKEDDLLMWDVVYELDKRQQFSVSCFCISGNEYADLGGVLNWDEEEHWLTMHQTGVLGRHNAIVGDAMVAHYTFFTQREFVDQTDILDRYRALGVEVSRSAKKRRSTA